MKTTRSFQIVLVTAPDRKSARSLAKAALTDKLVACANLIPGVESHYWWQGKLERGNEILIVLKTTRSKLGALEKLILAHHPYDTPEIVSLPIDSGTARYLAWIQSNVSP